VLGHLDESLPFLAWRIQHGINYGPNGRSTKKRLSDYFATMLTMGADRILFAVDYRYEDCAQGGDFIAVPIAEIDRRKIAYDNAKALYKL
jgi:2,3-dihydroxybenzoate decarboxylase